MTQQEKMLDTFLKNPTSLRARDIIKILTKAGFTFRDAKGSHEVYQKGRHTLSIPIHNNDCKNIYKKKALKVYEQAQAENDAE